MQKGKRGTPPLDFSITDFNWRVMAIYGAQFGGQNDKDIIKHDDNVCAIRQNCLLANLTWQYYDCGENVRSERENVLNNMQ